MDAGLPGAANPPPVRAWRRDEVKVVVASSFGTVFEWYDFYLYAAVAPLLARKFFSGVDDATGFLLALAVFSAGFLMRPFGAILFGHLGDRRGRRRTLVSTIVVMGLATAAIGLLPTFETAGYFAPLALVILRLVQGLAIGGEWGGAATYVAEHAPPHRRGLYTSWIQTTASLGLFLAIALTNGAEVALGSEAFEAWGWRAPFLFSLVLVAGSVQVRRSLAESPVFERLAQSGRLSRAPLREVLGQRRNAVALALAIFGLVVGQAVVWYTSQIYALLFLQQTMHVDATTARLLFGLALLLACPFFVLFGAISDRVGRKRVILAGCLFAALTYVPIYDELAHYANPQLVRAQQKQPITVVGDPKECGAWFESLGSPQARTSCDAAKRFLAVAGVQYGVEAGAPGALSVVHVGKRIAVESYRPLDERAAAESDRFAAQMDDALYAQARYPRRTEASQMNKPMVVLLLAILIIYVAMVYGPMAAALADRFPPRHRYTSVSLAYHIGNGWFGGLVPTVAFAAVAFTGNALSGLWYPITAALITCAVGTLFLRERGAATSSPDL